MLSSRSLDCSFNVWATKDIAGYQKHMDGVYASGITRSNSRTDLHSRVADAGIEERDRMGKVEDGSTETEDREEEQVKEQRRDDEVEDIIDKTAKLKLSQKRQVQWKVIILKYVNPIVITAIAAFVRLYRIAVSNFVVWDEAHFGKFGAFYLERQYYFDVHPPLGKLLIALSGLLANFDGSFKFEGGEYPENCNYKFMRCFNCMFGILCAPLAYKTALKMGYSLWTVYFISLMVAFEMLSMTLSKFILLDSILLFFTVLCFYCLVNVHTYNMNNELLSLEGLKWLFLTGINIGCVCSVKWVGIFAMALIGFYVVYDLLVKTYEVTSSQGTLKLKTYLFHWISRIATLIVIPFALYLCFFKVHFMVLRRVGNDSASLSTLMQASLEGNKLEFGPRTVAFGSLVTLRSQGVSSNLLHSHPHVYPEGSGQQQITTYGFHDDNNDFLVEFDLEGASKGEYATLEREENDTYPLDRPVKSGDTVRLMHRLSGCFLHSHMVPFLNLRSQFEVSCYGNLDFLDPNDEWVIEIQKHDISPSPYFQNESVDEVHPISTSFRLRHKELGCYLATTGYNYPSWGYSQGEVVCKKAFATADKNTWWNVETHQNPEMPMPEQAYVPPRPRFWKEFVLLNYAMMTSNNALIPDPDKADKLRSQWWEWPTLYTGLRMNSWSDDSIKYYLIGHPLVIWLSSLCLLGFCLYLSVLACLWQRQVFHLAEGLYDPRWNNILIRGIVPFLGWLLHFIPFVLMGRVTYIHHYVPALYFAIFVSGFFVEHLVNHILNRYVKVLVYFFLYISIIAIFWYYRHLSFGMEGSSQNFEYLRLLPSWTV